ncbi:MAG TPA: HAD hydrolase family protein [Rectinemataceae bacterium]|nr:HAD hydrolase family protein [Rectinemataceae bacterium]
MSRTDRIKVLALDLDGTVLAPGNRLSRRNVEAVEAFRRRGGLVVVASGRARRSALPWALRLGGASALVCHNGAAVYELDGKGSVVLPAAMPGAEAAARAGNAESPEKAAGSMPPPQAEGVGRLIAETRLPEEVCRRLVALSREVGVHFHGFAEDAWLYECSRPGTPVYEARSGFPGLVVDFDTIPSLAFHKAMFVGEPGPEIDSIAGRARELCSDSATVLFSGPGFLEIVAAGVSKARGLRAFLDRRQLALEEVFAIGDAENDEEMLLASGIGVVMGDAPAELRARVGRVTAGIAEDGAALAIEAFLAGRL